MSKTYNQNIINKSITTYQLTNTPIDTSLSSKVINDGTLSWNSSSQSWSIGAIIPSTKGQNSQILTNVNGNNIWSYPGYNYRGSNMFPQNTVDTTSMTVSSDTNKWSGGVLAPNGKIYGIPYNSTSVLIIDPITNEINTISGISADTNKWSGGVLAPNGKIYGIPYNSTSVLIIDPVNNTVDTTSMTVSSDTNKWSGGILSQNGKIYGIPFDSDTVLVIDPTTNTTSTITGLTDSSKYVGGVLAPNGKIYGISYDSNNILIIKTGLPILTQWMLAPEFNKF